MIDLYNSTRVAQSRTLHVCKPLSTQYKTDDRVHGYTVKKVLNVKDLDLKAVWLSHDQTGAQHLHIDKEDGDNVFGVSFRTTPMDSTGVPHILEHTALCGSQRYPVRDPFFKMMNRSLATFMNAFTANDWTMYPFSTQNAQDYKNLMSVYLDAAFYPQLTESDFRQEGWRLEHDQPDNTDSPISLKGIVYNEMKGVFSNSQHLFADRVRSTLLPSHTYGVVSGGDPPAILDLTWEQLREFHRSHYHPSNSRFYTYGTFPLENHLKFINENVLSKFTAISPGTEVPNEPQWGKPRELYLQCAPDPLSADQDKQTTLAVTFMLPDITNMDESFTLSMISTLLVDGENSPFYRSLIETNIGSDYSPVLGYDKSCRNGSFSVGLQGLHNDDVEKVKGIIDDTIDEVIRNGFEQQHIDALLHRIELSLKHQYSKFGLNLLVSLTYYWNHDCDPTESIDVGAYVDRLKQNMKENPKYLQNFVEKHLKNNKHKLITVMTPDAEFEQNRQETESAQLAKMVEKLSDSDKTEIYQKGLELQTIQSTEQDISCLPSLNLTDIPENMDRYKHSTQNINGCNVQISEQPTNGVTYFRGLANTHELPVHLQPYLPLYANVLTKMGAGSLDYRDFAQKIDLYTGGLSAACHVTGHHTRAPEYKQGLLLSSFCLDKNVEHMWQIWLDIFNELDLSDNERLTTLIRMSAMELSHSLSDAGHRYAMTSACSGLTPVCRLNETYGGMSHVKFMSALAETQDLSPVAEVMKEISQHLLIRNNLSCALNTSSDGMSEAVKQMSGFLSNLNSTEQQSPLVYNSDSDFTPQYKQTHFELPFQVNFVAKCFPTVPYAHEDYSSLRILARLMTNKYLHREIREKGGAYGGGAVSNKEGTFQFYSYRDPNFLNTLKSFTNGVEWAKNGRFTKQDVDEAKLAIFAQVDSPIPPGERGLRNFLSDIDDDLVQQHRQQLFNVNKDSIAAAIDRYLLPRVSQSSVCLLGAENSSTRDNPDWDVQMEHRKDSPPSHIV